MNDDRLLKYLTLIVFVGFIFIIPIITLSTPDKKISEIENKILTQMPKLSFNNIKNKSFMNKFDKYSSDQFPARVDFIKLKNSYNYLIGNKEFRDIYVGMDDKLMEKFIFNKDIVDKNIYQTTKLSKYLYDNHNIKSKLMVIPTSIAFYEDKLPTWAITDNQLDTLNYIQDKINEDDKLDFYSPYNILNKHKDKYIYFNTDHHWTQLGARIAYEDMYNSTDFFDNKEKDHYNLISDDFYGTYYSKVLLPQIKSDSIFAFENFNDFNIKIDFDKEFDSLYDYDKLKGKNKYQYFLHGDPAFAIIEGNKSLDNEILIFKDSYAHSFIPFLTSNYSKIHIVDPRYYDLDVLDYLNKNKDINNILFINNIQTFSNNLIYKNLNL